MHIKIDDLKDGRVVSLLESHLQKMYEFSPAASVHALDHEKLKDSSITFWSACIDGALAGCGALKELSGDAAEIKSMKTNDLYLRQGVASKLLEEILTAARVRGYKTVNLETGTHEAFIPAVKMYKKFGFAECEPFGEYKLDIHSHFFSKVLQP
ncbi:GNAT family N-acetyltransferase [Marinagarivorans algicola]|uniref:GNAT family N-acetyltransferase n=1 Tax=Marinagarivorans algicola TaxID=1513270 RepID=UPI003735BA9D